MSDKDDDEATEAHPPAEEWVDRYGSYLYTIALQRLQEEDLAQDLVQTTFLHALQGLDSYRGVAEFRFWLRGILVNLANNHLRAISRREEVAQVSDELVENLELETPVDAAQRQDVRHALEQCLNELPERSRYLFEMKEIEGLSQKEIAEDSGLTVSNVSVILTRARQFLRDCLEGLLRLGKK